MDNPAWQDLRDFVDSQNWRFATSVPDQPHWYIVGARCPDREGFEALRSAIREHGVTRRFLSFRYRYLELGDGYDYWEGPPGLLNRRHHVDQDVNLDTWKNQRR